MFASRSIYDRHGYHKSSFYLNALTCLLDSPQPVLAELSKTLLQFPQFGPLNSALYMTTENTGEAINIFANPFRFLLLRGSNPIGGYQAD